MTVLVLGNVTLDLVFKVQRFPRPGETVMAGRRDVDVGGKGANQAVVASRFGATVRLVAAIGNDADGGVARDRLAAEIIDLSGLLKVSAATDQSVIMVDRDGENCIVSSHAAAASISPEDAVSVVRDLTPVDWLVMQGNLSQAATMAALEEAKRRGAGTIFNPAPIHWDVLPLMPAVDFLVLNSVELATLVDTDDPIDGGMTLCAAGAGQVLVTLGADGVAIIDDTGATRLPAPEIDAIDTAGAGDTFCGVLVAGLAQGDALKTATELAITAAALTVTRAGTYSAFPTATEATSLLSDQADL
jgi:ribokinase